MRNNDVLPRFASIFSGKLGGTTAELSCSFGFGENIRIIHILFSFGFAHIDCVCGFYDEVRLIAFCSIGPVDIELVRHRANPFQYLIARLKHNSKVKFRRTIEAIFGVVGFFEAYIYKFDGRDSQVLPSCLPKWAGRVSWRTEVPC